MPYTGWNGGCYMRVDMQNVSVWAVARGEITGQGGVMNDFELGKA